MSLSAAEWIAIGACAGAAIALLVAGLAWLKLRAVRSSQLVLLGGGKQDLVDFAVSLQGRMDDLHRAVDEIAAGLSRVDRRVDTTVSKTSLVRYDAYEGAGGHQSASIALLDAGRSGVIVTAIQGRDYARIYVKELDHGRPSVALSPEEEQAVFDLIWYQGFSQEEVALSLGVDVRTVRRRWRAARLALSDALDGEPPGP